MRRTQARHSCAAEAQGATPAAVNYYQAGSRHIQTFYGQLAAELGIPAPEGGAFLFVDVSRRLDERGIWGFLEDCLDDGVALAPGPSCGEAYTGWVRLCFTAAPPDDVLAAARKLAKRLR